MRGVKLPTVSLAVEDVIGFRPLEVVALELPLLLLGTIKEGGGLVRRTR
jgi:hypothetical protein